MNYSDITDPLFREAVQAIDLGAVVELQRILEQYPQLTTTRLPTPSNEGYFKNPYLLWFVANNPIRNQHLPSSILEITELIIECLQGCKNEHYQFIMDYTLGLVSTGRIVRETGVQIQLMKLLVKKGAIVKESVLGPLALHSFEAAAFLLDNGARYDLATAVGLNKMREVPALIKEASPSQKNVALVVASFFGNSTAVSLLISGGVDVNGVGTIADFGGFHSHAGALHQAVYAASLESVIALVEAGADLEAVDKMYSGTPLDWAIHLQKDSNEVAKAKYKDIETYLSVKIKM